MGRVFMWEEIRSRMIPALSSFTEVVLEVRKTIEDSPAIGGIICGSVNHGHHNIRSDIDLLVFYEERNRAEMVALMLSLDQFAQERFVPLDFIQLTPELAGTNMQSISPSMAQHIDCSARRGGLIKLNPFHILDVYKLNHRQEAVSWARQKVRMLDEGAVHRYNPIREAYFLQRLLEAPINGTRKLLLTTGGFEDDSKQAVLSLTEERYPRLVKPLSRLVALDAIYTQALQAEADFPGEYDEDTYQDLLLSIRSQIGYVSRYIIAVGQLLEA